MATTLAFQPHSRGAVISPRSGGVLQRFEEPLLRLDRVVSRALPDHLNPLIQAGSVANICLLVAIVSGLLLLFWYDTSVHGAHASLAAMQQHPFSSGLMRTLHRVSSDAAMFFVLLHAVRTFLAGRFRGARWLAWVMGMALVVITWGEGWIGYWLAWDERGRQVALGTARLVDAAPIFSDPLSRSFLTDSSINSLLFFLVFFLHVLVPLVMALAFAFHVMRLSRPSMLPARPLLITSIVGMIALSIALPADLAAPARMAIEPQGFAMDWWYLAPLVLTDRLGAGALWAIGLGGFTLLCLVPWMPGRRTKAPAIVEPTLCNGCTKCSVDCPHDAITMVARTDGRDIAAGLAQVDPARCVACGICAGSCDSAGVGMPWLSAVEERRRVDAWIETALGANERPVVVFACDSSAGAGLHVDAGSGECEELPEARVLRVPCAGWLHPLTLERALRRGARRVVVAACAEGSCPHREGSAWTRERITGAREPHLRTDKVDATRVELVQLPRGCTAELVGRLRKESHHSPRAGTRGKALLAACALMAGLALVVGWPSRAGYPSPLFEGSELVVSFAHPGKLEENCRDVSPEELAALPVHMRKPRICDRRRAPVRVSLEIDGNEVLARAHEGEGIRGDAVSVAVDRVRVEPGAHDVRVRIGDTSRADEWAFETTRSVSFEEGKRTVVLFDRDQGFRWF